MNQPLDSAARPAPSFRLSLMMFLQYAVWGAWLPVVGKYLGSAAILNDAGERIGGGLGFTGTQIGVILGTAGAVGAITAPFIAGQVADRWFAAERCLFVLMFLGGIVKYLTAGMNGYTEWLIMSIAYSVLYMPTIAISNSLAFSHLSDPKKQFPPIRVWGTIGWIAVSWVFPMVWLQHDLHLQSMPPFLVGEEHPDVVSRLADALRFSGMLSAGYAFYCLLVLPHTPPKKSVESLALARAAGLWLENKGLLALTLIALPIAALHTIYFIQTSQFLPTLEGVRDSDIGPAMSIGQFSEIFVLGALGFFLKHAGFKWALIVGALAYCARYAVFALGAPTELVIASQALHGVCFACFYATAFIYVDRVSPVDVRHSAQTLFGIVILGVGPLLSAPALNAMNTYASGTALVSECLDRPNLIPQQQRDPADATKTLSWDSYYPGAEADIAAYVAANPDDLSRGWKGLKPDTKVNTLDYARFWMIASVAGLLAAAALAALFRVDPEANKGPATDGA